MSEVSYLWDTNGTGDGTITGYTEADHAVMFQLFTQGSNKSGVAPDRDNELAASGAATPVTIATGSAIVHGTPYRNSTAVTVTIPTPSTATRIDRIVLRKSWAAQTVRITRIAGTEGGSFPAIVESDGTTWDLPLCRVSITTGGVITITDERVFMSILGDNQVDNTKLADMAAATVKGRATGAGTGDPTDLTATQVRTLINVEDGADVTDAANVASIIHAATAKTVPANNDEFALIDSAAANVLKRLTYADLVASITGLTITEGSITPRLLIGGSATGITYSVQTGRYWKIDDMVFFYFYIVLSSKGSNSGNLTIDQWPVTVRSGSDVSIIDLWWSGLAASLVNAKMFFNAGTTVASLYAITAAATTMLTSMTAAQLNNNSVLQGSGLYFAN